MVRQQTFFNCATPSPVFRFIFGFCFISILLLTTYRVPSYGATPKHGGTFIEAVAGEEADLNPVLTGGAAVTSVIKKICNQLVGLDWNMNPEPELAESWQVSEDGLTYTFKLVKNATWHDGKPFTSADVTYNMNELAPRHFRSGKIWQNVTATAPDKYTVVMKLKQPFAPFLTALGHQSSAPFILPKHLYEGTDLGKNPYNRKPIGTGPFKFSKWIRGEYIELVRNNNYFEKGKEDLPYLDRIVFKLVPDPTARILALKNGEIDFIATDSMPVEHVPELQKDTNIVIDKRGFGSLSMKWLWFNLRNPPFSNKLVRQAIAHAIDKQKVIDLALVGVGRVAKSIINTEMKWAFNSKAPDYPYDPAKAETLLDKAGYPRGKDGIRFKKRFLVIGGRGSDGRVGEVIRDQLKQVGIEAELIATDRATFVNTMFMNWDFDMAFQQGATAPDPTVGATRFIATNMIMKSPFVNATGFSNPEVDKLLDGEFKEQNKEKRVALWHRIQVIFNEELPMIPIYEQPLINVYRSEWTDVITGPDQAQVNGKTYKRK